MCMRSMAWLAASVWLRLARVPPPASRVRRSRHLRDTLAAAPGLLAHASVTETVKLCPMGPKLRHTGVHVLCGCVALVACASSLGRLCFAQVSSLAKDLQKGSGAAGMLHEVTLESLRNVLLVVTAEKVACYTVDCWSCWVLFSL